MAKKSTSLSPFPKLLKPSYYFRKPQRLATIFLFLLVLLYIQFDRRYISSQRDILTSKVKELESETEVLESALAKSQQLTGGTDSVLPSVNGLTSTGSNESSSSRLKVSHKKSLPLILGVTQRGILRGDREHHVRKILPEKVDSVTADESHGSVSKEQQNSREKHLKEETREEEQSSGEKDPEVVKNEERRQAIKWGMQHAWSAYEQYAWGFDELQPQSKSGINHFAGLGATIVDSLDTLYIMGLTAEFDKAKQWVFDNMDFNKDYDCSVFETTIRVLGGLLSAFDLSGEEKFLHKARELADRLLPAWNTPTGIPHNYLNLANGNSYNAGWSGGSSILADIGTTTLEMIGLSQRTGDPKYGQKAENVIKQIKKVFPEDGLMPIYISPDDGHPTSSKVSFGAMGDSFFEYLIKAWVQGGKSKPVEHYKEMWETSMKGFRKLVRKSSPSGLTYIAEQAGGSAIDKMDHLACFVGGMLVLGSEGPFEEEYVNLAKEITRTCYEFYDRMPSKLSGEHYLFNTGDDFVVGHAYNIGRPETVESLMYLWRKTHDPIYREWGWNIWQAFEKQCRLPSGYTGLRDVSQEPPEKDDMMQSFFLAETIKYLYLLFSDDDVVPLDQWVFNTEAHPLKIISRAAEETALVVA